MNANTINIVRCINKTMEAWANYLQAGGVDHSCGTHMNTLLETVTVLYQEQPGANINKEAIVKAINKHIPCTNCGHKHGDKLDQTPKNKTLRK